jgi:hypothetical protein
MASNLPRPDHVVLNAARARQGRHGRHVLWVLLASTALAALVLFGAWTWRAPALSSTPNGPSKAAAASFDAGPPALQVRQNATAGARDSHPSGSPR